MSEFVRTSKPPYYAVILATVKSDDQTGYAEMNARMFEFAQQQKGRLGIESARGEIGLSVTRWETLKDIHAWRNHAEHLAAQVVRLRDLVSGVCGVRLPGLSEIIFTRNNL